MLNVNMPDETEVYAYLDGLLLDRLTNCGHKFSHSVCRAYDFLGMKIAEIRVRKNKLKERARKRGFELFSIKNNIARLADSPHHGEELDADCLETCFNNYFENPWYMRGMPIFYSETPIPRNLEIIAA